MMAITDKTMTQKRTPLRWVSTLGKNGSEKRMKPYVPIFRRTPARITDPAVGASTWASGSQVWKGNIGTLIAKPRKNARKTQYCRSGGIDIANQRVTSNVPVVSRPGIFRDSK